MGGISLIAGLMVSISFILPIEKLVYIGSSWLLASVYGFIPLFISAKQQAKAISFSKSQNS